MTPAEALHEALAELPVEPDPHPDTLVPLVLAALREGAVERVQATWGHAGPAPRWAIQAVDGILGPVPR